MSSCLSLCTPCPFNKGVYFVRKELAPTDMWVRVWVGEGAGEHVRSFSSRPFPQVSQNSYDRELSPLEVLSIPLHRFHIFI